MNGIQGINFGGDMGVRTAASNKSNGVGFGDFLQQAIANVESTEAQHNQNTAALMAGEVNDLSQVTISAQKYTTSLMMLTTVRDKVVEAYTEIMRMQV